MIEVQSSILSFNIFSSRLLGTVTFIVVSFFSIVNALIRFFILERLAAVSSNCMSILIPSMYSVGGSTLYKQRQLLLNTETVTCLSNSSDLITGVYAL